MQGELDSLRPYNYTEFVVDGSLQYDFQTASGREYNCYFIDASDYFPQYAVILNNIVTFGFRLVSPDSEGFLFEYDNRIRDTVLDILCLSMKVHPERLVLITYDNTDSRQRCRKIIFSAWHKNLCKLLASNITKYGLTIRNFEDRVDMYLTIFIPPSNPHVKEIGEALMDMRDELISKGYPPGVTFDVG